MRNAKIYLLGLILAFLLLVIIYSALAAMPWSRIEEYKVEGVCTYSIESAILRHLGESYLFFDRFDLKKELLALGYISDVGFSFKDNTLYVYLESPLLGTMINSSEEAMFYDGNGIFFIDRKDISGLEDRYLRLTLDNDYFLYCKSYGFDSSLIDILSFLSLKDKERTLITNAEYDNNYGRENGKLILFLDSLNSTLIISDLEKLKYFEESIDIISKDIEELRYDTIFSTRLYELKSSGLVLVKR